jgi:hypothetical protein
MNPVITGSQLVTFLRTNFADSYRISYDAMRGRLGRVMDLGIPSDRRIEFYGYYETAPYPERVPMGQNPPSKNFKSRSFSVTNYDWMRRVEWHINDRKDEQTKTLPDQARSAGEHWATLEERLFFQILTGATDPKLLPVIPIAPDGAALFNATDGDGGNRFGVSGGNLFANGGVSTGAAIRTDFFKAVALFKRFQDTEGQPLWDESVIDEGFTVIYPAVNLMAYAEAFNQKQNAQAATTATSNAGVSNVIFDAGLKVTLWPTQRLTGNTWYVIANGAKKKPIFSQTREGIYEVYATEDNSDLSRDTGAEYVQWKSRGSAAVGPAYGAVQIT